MSEYRENYFIARKNVAKELKDKYGLVESYEDTNRLTLDSSNYSIHLTFYVPDGDDVFISEKGKEPGHGRNFMYFIFGKFPSIEDAEIELKRIFSDSSSLIQNQNDEYSIKRLEISFLKKVEYLKKNHGNFFN